MLAPGGLLDQPAALWFRAQSAGWLDSLLERTSKQNFDWSTLPEVELEFFMTVIQPLQTEPLP